MIFSVFYLWVHSKCLIPSFAICSFILALKVSTFKQFEVRLSASSSFTTVSYPLPHLLFAIIDACSFFFVSLVLKGIPFPCLTLNALKILSPLLDSSCCALWKEILLSKNLWIFWIFACQPALFCIEACICHTYLLKANVNFWIMFWKAFWSKQGNGYVYRMQLRYRRERA